MNPVFQKSQIFLYFGQVLVPSVQPAQSGGDNGLATAGMADEDIQEALYAFVCGDRLDALFPQDFNASHASAPFLCLSRR